jgi:hypothetical protein
MERLEEKYELSRQWVQKSAQSVQMRIDWSLHNHSRPYSLSAFGEDLGKNRIDLVIPALRQSNPRGWQQRVTDLLDNTRPQSEKPPIKPDDGHGFFYVDFNQKAVVRDTEIGQSHTAEAILQRTGIDKELHKMHRDHYFKLSNAQESILRPDYPDTAEARKLLLRLSPVHDNIVEKQLELQEQQTLAQRHSQGMRHGL